MRRSKRTYFLFVPLVLLGLTGCEEDISQPGSGPKPRTAAAAAKAPVVEEKKVSRADIREADFVENDASRDPFRSYAKAFLDEARGQVKSQREVVLEQYSVDELKLIGIITGVRPERAMLVDPTGLGHVVTRGQFVGRASVVQPAGGVGTSYEVNWRVERIRDGDLVLVRDDPSNPDVPSSTRVIPLRIDDVTTSTEPVAGDDVQSQLSQLKQQIQSMEAQESAKKRATAPKP